MDEKGLCKKNEEIGEKNQELIEFVSQSEKMKILLTVILLIV